MEKKSEAPGQNFPEDKAVHYLCSVMQWASCFTINNFDN